MSVRQFVMEVEVRRYSALILLLLFAPGCQCGMISECYSNKIESIVCKVPRFDRFYKATHDLSRIGQPDWCCSSLNRMLCPCACDKSCGGPCDETCGSCQEQGLYAGQPDGAGGYHYSSDEF